MNTQYGRQAKQADLTLCPCGSGLRTLRCCEQNYAAQPDPAHNALLSGLLERITQARAEGRNRDAARRAIEILDLAPLLPEALLALFEIRLAEENKKAACALAARLVVMEPENALALGRYAGVLAAREQYQEAIETARQGLLVAPHLPVLHQILGISFTELGMLQEGEHHYRQALSLLPAAQKPQQENNLAWNLRQQGRLEEAAALYVALEAQGWKTARTLTSFAQVQAGLGQAQKAEALLKAALDHSPHDRLATLLLALLRLHHGAPKETLALIAETEAHLSPKKLVVTEHIARGRALERLGQYESAWTAYETGRNTQRAHVKQGYDPTFDEARLAALKVTFKAGRLASIPSPPPSSKQPQPLFLLGVAGSGTSLLERLLCQSPSINPADQHAPLPTLAKLLPALAQGLGGPELSFPEALTVAASAQGAEIPALLAARYLEKLIQNGFAGVKTKFITDRHVALPWVLGLGVSLFPQAPVVHLLRHPLDVVLSGYTRDQLFESRAGLTLAGLAQAYDSQMQAIAHLRGQMTMRYLSVRYEDLLRDPATTLERVYRFIGLHETSAKALLAAPRRTVPRVPPYYTQPATLDQTGLYRHRHFGAALAEVETRLTPWIESLGYGETKTP